ncbi:hypothetical protein [Burkholderia ambifaria]|uniref:hypothetical protein n=1 Tax=Burkholderia ambifaria TaxID=152480 RepID=UPI0002F080D0|nr:hypothetical protein [Burkholderia ambifaria]
MLPQARAERRAFFTENRLVSNRRHHHPVPRHAAAHPLTHADTTAGVLKVMSPDVDGFSAADAGTLRLMAD